MKVFIGLYGARKDLYAQKLFPELEVVYSGEQKKIFRKFNPDFPEELNIEEKKGEMKDIMEYVLTDKSFIFITPVLNPQRLCRTIAEVIDFGYNVEIYYVPTSVEQVLAWNKERKYPIPEDVLVEEADSMDFTLSYLESKTCIKINKCASCLNN